MKAIKEAEQHWCGEEASQRLDSILVTERMQKLQLSHQHSLFNYLIISHSFFPNYGAPALSCSPTSGGMSQGYIEDSLVYIATERRRRRREEEEERKSKKIKN